VTNFTFYELPLNERIRTFLRLEFLFQQARYSMRGYSVWDSRATISSILDITNIINRIDLRSELIKELERQSKALEAISSSPNVDSSILDETLCKLKNYNQTLKAMPKALHSDLSMNELLKSIRQRESVPGGTCNFDMPAYNFWLKQEPEQRIQLLETWLNHLDHYRLSIDLVLSLLRESAINTPIKAEEGFYQQALDTSTPFQLIRVILPEKSGYYAEISGGKHRFSVRFMLPTTSEKASPTNESVDFQLSCCAL